MTVKQIMIEQLGEKGFENLSPNMKKLVRRIDSLPPLPRRRRKTVSA